MYERMPFGKHKDELIDDIPVAYLRWVLDNVSDLWEDTRAAIEHRLGREAVRSRPNPTPPPPGLDPSKTTETVLGIVRDVRRELALRYHPDHGGSTEVMTAINNFVDTLAVRVPRRLQELATR